MNQQSEKLLHLLQEEGLLRPRDLADHGLPPSALHNLYQQGKVIRMGRGLYAAPDASWSEHYSLALACKQVPHGVVCLLSALRFHEIGSQNPFDVWLAIDRKGRMPQVDHPPLRIVRFSQPARTAGVEEHSIDGVSVPIFSVAKTIADCFKYRHKIGLDVALEALQESLRQRRVTHQEVWRYAQICRVSNVIKPYLEALA